MSHWKRESSLKSYFIVPDASESDIRLLNRKRRQIHLQVLQTSSQTEANWSPGTSDALSSSITSPDVKKQGSYAYIKLAASSRQSFSP